MRATLPRTITGTFHLVFLVLLIPLILAVTAGSADRESIEAFHAAAGSGDLAAVRDMLVRDEGLLEAKNAGGSTPLHTAAQAGQLEVVEVLVAEGARVDSGDNENTTPLGVAALGGHLEVVDFLIARGADPLAADDNLSTPFHWATYYGHLDVARRLVDLGADVHAVKANGSNAMHGPAYTGHLETVEFLVGLGCEIDLQNQRGFTPLLLAAFRGNNDVLTYLIDAGADTGIWNDWQSLLHLAAISGNLETVKIVVATGADVNARTGEASTALIPAIGSENPEVVAYLLDSGADPNLGWPSGFSPLQFAVNVGNREIAELLIRGGADVNAEDEDSRTPLSMAVREGNTELAGILVAAGARVNGKDPYFGRTPLHITAAAGNSELAGILLANGAAVDATDTENCTALDLAMRYGNRDVAELLEARGGRSNKNVENYGHCQLLESTLEKGEALMWYTGHCGWVVKTRNHLLIFDYWNQGTDPASPSLANGHINTDEIGDFDVTVFVTHEHRDHFDSTIFDWQGEVDRIRYVYGFRPETLPQYRQTPYNGPAYEYIGPRENTTLGGMKISTIEANDAGVGFLVEVDGITLYHAGDHAGWAEGEKQGYLDEIDYLAGFAGDIDVAFVNVTGCHAHNPDALREGTYYTLEKLRPRTVVPTHAGGSEHRYVQAIEQAAEDGIEIPYACPKCRGDRFVYNGGTIRQDMRDASS
jgi:ankyrin repeat protein